MNFWFLVLLASPILFGLPTSSAATTAKQNTECPPNFHWVRAHHRKSYIRGDGTLVAASDVIAHCQSDPPSYSKWKDRFKNIGGSNTFEKTGKYKEWTTEEKERFLEALADLPPLLLLDSVHSIYRAEKSLEFDKNPASGKTGNLVLYDDAFSKKQRLSRVLAHELAHELFRQIPAEKRKSYGDATRWKRIFIEKTREYKLIPLRFEYVEEDGLESITEDFSNNLEYYLFDPKKLKSVTPEAYEWFRSEFGDSLKLGPGIK